MPGDAGRAATGPCSTPGPHFANHERIETLHRRERLVPTRWAASDYDYQHPWDDLSAQASDTLRRAPRATWVAGISGEGRKRPLPAAGAG